MSSTADTMSESKRQMNSSDFEVDSHDLPVQAKIKTLSLLDNVRTALTTVTLLSAVTVLAVSADSLAVYQATHLPSDYLLPLWPADFNIRPTLALVICSAIVVLTSGVSLGFGRIKSLGTKAALNAVTVLVPTIISFIAAVIAISFFYTVNASKEVDTVQSWSCQWRDVSMTMRPHFGTLCKQSQAGLGLSVALVPLQIIILGVSIGELIVLKAVNAMGAPSRKTPSPAY
ncbi:hypothetical protein jhhlp_002073 [Lomentospora prolificans]|uniref:MARVEL domain-containing protein n=1 Tax=Lomentospora prolificans TaxID=41688 RepID=A0A2N3ND84_9PEZI|nr:hypothetical protein jhhlp_002073 [Lomentospora prolificans]